MEGVQGPSTMAASETRLPHLERYLSFQALESVRSAIVISDANDPEHRIIYVNPAFETLTGFSPDETVDRNCRFLQGEDRNQQSRSEIRTALTDTQPIRTVLRNYRKDGTLFCNELFIDPVLDSDGKPICFVACQNAVAEPRAALLFETALQRSRRLTAREHEVFELVVSGFPSKLIARALAISPRTVEKHRKQILEKFEVVDLTLLVRFALALGVPFREPPGLTAIEAD